jgi:hypothetical protein
MSDSVRILRDLKIAAFLGFATELLLAGRMFAAQGELGYHPWLEISQMPGAQIAERVFRHSGLRIEAPLAFAIVLQAIFYGAIALGIIYFCRIASARGNQATGATGLPRDRH